MTLNATSSFAFPGVTAIFEFTGHTDRGAIRSVNEDSFVAVPPIFVVADGMGGHAHGDRASQTAVAAFARQFADAQPARPDAVLDVIRQANENVLGLTLNEPGTLSGTTLAGIAFVRVGTDDYHWMVFNVGDSRIYRWDGRKLVQVSVDHSAVQELVDAGAITRVEADTHPERNVVTRALGADPEVDPDIWLLPASGHQTFLICSDGLTKELSDDEIARIIVFHFSREPGERGADDHEDSTMPLGERLVKAAIAAGGSDNVTAIIVESQSEEVSHLGDDTIDRNANPTFLEETMPRGPTR